MIVGAESASVGLVSPDCLRFPLQRLNIRIPTRSHLQPRPHHRPTNYCILREDTGKMGKDPKAKAHSHSRSSGSISNLPYSAVAAAAEMDRKVYIPLCFCLVSFAVMVYIN